MSHELLTGLARDSSVAYRAGGPELWRSRARARSTWTSTPCADFVLTVGFASA